MTEKWQGPTLGAPKRCVCLILIEVSAKRELTVIYYYNIKVT